MGAWLSRLRQDGNTTQLALLNCATWAALMVVQFGLPLEFRSEATRRFDTPITPAGYCFGVIWSTIFLLQGLGSLVPVLPGGQWAAPYVQNIGFLWAGTWVTEGLWTTIQAIQQRVYSGREPTAGFVAALGMLLGGHVIMSLALRQTLGPYQAALFNTKPSVATILQAPTLKHPIPAAAATTDGSAAAHHPSSPPPPPPSTWLQRLGGTVLYVLPSALNAGWLGLASCLGALQVAVSASNLTFTELVKPGLALLPVAAATAALQPWWNPDPPAGKCPVGGGAVVPLLVGGGGYAAAVMWGLSGMVARDYTPGEVKDAASVLLGVVPALALGGSLCRLMVGVRRAKAKKAAAEGEGQGAGVVAGPTPPSDRQPLLS